MSGEKAASSQVNANFDYIFRIIVGLIVEDAKDNNAENAAEDNEQSLSPRLRFGPRGTGLLTAIQDTGSAENSFLQLGWNIRWSKVNDVWVFNRFIQGGRGAALRIGYFGMEYYGSYETSGQLNGQMKKYFSIGPRATSYMFFIPQDVHFQHFDGDIRTLQDFRLTTVFLDFPVKVYSGQSVLTKGRTIKDVTNFGIPSLAKAIIVYADVHAATNSGVAIHIYRKVRPKGDDNDEFPMRWTRGFTLYTHPNGRTAGQGVVPLGDFESEGLFEVERSETCKRLRLVILGYLI